MYIYICIYSAGGGKNTFPTIWLREIGIGEEKSYLYIDVFLVPLAVKGILVLVVRSQEILGEKNKDLHNYSLSHGFYLPTVNINPTV